MKKFTYVTVFLWLALVSALNAKPSISETAVAAETLEPGTPPYIAIKYQEALKAGDFTAALNYASRHRVLSQKWQMDGNPGIAENISRMSLTHIAVDEEKTKLEEHKCELHFYVQSNREGKPYWCKLHAWFLKIDGKWLLVHLGEYKKEKLFPKELDPPPVSHGR